MGRQCALLCVVGLFTLACSACHASDVIWTSAPATVFNSSCREFTLPPSDLCVDCTVRRTTFVVEPHHTPPSQLITLADYDGKPADTVVVVDNTATGKFSAVRTSSGYMLCATGEGSSDSGGFTTAVEVLLTLTPTILPSALQIAQTWVQPDHLATFVQLNGVSANTTACVHAGTATDQAQCMQLCTAMDSCTYFVQHTSGGCELCLDATIYTHVWGILPGGAAVFIRGKQLRLFFSTADNSVASGQQAYPGKEAALQTMFTVFAVFLMTAFLYMGCYFDIATIRCKTDNDIVDGVPLNPAPPPPREHGLMDLSALGLDAPPSKNAFRGKAPLATQNLASGSGVVYGTLPYSDRNEFNLD